MSTFGPPAKFSGKERPSSREVGSISEGVWKILIRSNVEEQRLKELLVPYFIRERIREVFDLEFVEKEELKETGLSTHEVKKLMRVLHPGKDKQQFQMKPELATANEDTEENQEMNTDIRYVSCRDLFASDVTEKTIQGLNLKKVTMNALVADIAKEIQCDEDHTVELFSSEGYPMNRNSVTGNATLDKWQIDQGDLFFAIPRKKNQPGTLVFASLPKIDHDVGLETITVEAPIYGIQEVRTFTDVDSAEDIAQKIYSLTDIDVPHMSLFIRNKWQYLLLNAFTDLKDKDTIRVMLRDPVLIRCPQTTNYGKKSYNPMVEQTDYGVSKFFSLLKYLVSNPRLVDREKLLSYLMKLSSFPPLVYSLATLFNYSYLSLAGWVALVEGCFCLFKALLATFATVPEEEVFEYSDYAWALLIHNSEECEHTSDVECKPVSLICPLSGKRILFPVLIPGCGEYCYDKCNVLAKLKDGKGLVSHGASKDLEENDLVVDSKTERLLMYFPWETDKEVLVWQKPPEFDLREQFVLKKISETFDWQMLPVHLTALRIFNPEGLDAGDECLTYIEQGRMVFYEGFSKDTDNFRVVYDPVKCSSCSYTIKILDIIGRQDLRKLVSKDLVKVLHSDKLATASQEMKETHQCKRIAAIIRPEESIQWNPEEAIVVLLDHSGSMRSSLFDQRSVQGELSWNRLTAAKEVFRAFATRTGAIRLHHSFGLTAFGSQVNVKFALSRRAEKFWQIIDEVTLGGSTALSPAMMDGVDQLVQYTVQYPSCLRRLLCLTDGFDDGSVPYEKVLQHALDNKVIIDTVLLTDSRGNPKQKAISHATGGICVIPSNANELLTLLELENMLSLQTRGHTLPSSKILSSFETPAEYPYETIEVLTTSKYINTKGFSGNEKTLSLKRSLEQGLTPTTSKQQRIFRELRNIQVMEPPHPDIAVFPSEAVYDHWKVLLRGPSGSESPYEGGSFILSVLFPEMYPSVPPKITFTTPIFHCNVSRSTGRICHEILGKHYTPSLSMVEILCSIYGLLVFPAFDSPLESAMAEHYIFNDTALNKQEIKMYDDYCDKVKALMREQTKTFEELRKELEGAK